MFQFLSKWFRPEAESLPPPMLDGPWSANDRLEAGRTMTASQDMDCICVCGDRLYVSAGNRLSWLDGERLATMADFSGVVSALAAGPDGTVVVAIEGHGLVRLDARGAEIARAAEPSTCITALACDASGSVYFTQGSQACRADEWYQDLMRLGETGGVGVWPSGAQPRFIRRGMRYANGIALAADGKLLVSEAWAHRILRIDPATGAAETVLENLAGYPGRLEPASGGGFWLAVFALRTLLVDFVLSEPAFRTEMIETIDPLYWVRPALSSGSSYLEPLQGGAIVKLGIRKAWSPPRSYGLVCRLSDSLVPLESFHSRVGGSHHGITSALDHGGRLLAVSKGAGKLLEVEASAR